ncbi:type II toxin-antitoxin system HigB family toxin [Methylobacterium oryzihabitans]|uniref:Type II toxin-antitoxin system HigB family toxin n=1 Tax=Methylobacterium oryzihabitans TaxID=2499852 RepID=A0A437NV39_9HYPH|nr:type II toxin-antitoxin system HigB family toxin [Methylobacterium oryzihabitans]RVU13882.1 type II toxin-antitoxin system HigB family toxin [Methylobacterium oryzihabitans]
MPVVTQARVWEAKERWPHAANALDAWYRLIKASEPSDFSSMKALFPATDKVGRFHVFDIGGNKIRLIAAVNYKFKKIYIQSIMDHSEYDKGKWR